MQLVTPSTFMKSDMTSQNLPENGTMKINTSDVHSLFRFVPKKVMVSV